MMTIIFYRFISMLMLASALALCGCASANYSSAELTKDMLSAEEISKTYNLNTSWWLGYGSTALNRTVDMALMRNVNLARTAIAVNKALYKARLLTSDLLPLFSADASVSATRDLGSDSRSKAAYNGKVWGENWRGEAAVNYELDLWRRLRDARDAGEWEHKATEEDLAGARLALINNVVDGWFYLLYTEQAVAVTEKSIERYQKILSLARSRYSLGKAAAVEPLQAEQSLLSAQNRLSSLRAQRAEALQTMRDLLNLRPGEMPYTDESDIMAIPDVPVDLNVPVAALAARPDIRATEARMQKSFKTMESERASWYPRLTVGSTLSFSADSADRFFKVPLLSGLASLSLPFLDWNTLRWNIKISEADFESAKLDLVESLTTALNEVDAACQAYAQARLTFEQTQSEHDRAARIAEYYRLRYEQGAAELKDYLEALTSADTSAVSSLSARHALIRWENRIYKAMGGRYEPL